MQKVKIPLKVDPIKCVQKRLDYDGIIMAKQFERLAATTEGVINDAEVKLSFDLDEQKLKICRAQVSVSVDLACQRCWKIFQQHCELEFTYSPIFYEDQAENLPEAYEPAWVDENGEIDLLQIIEDEIILSLPQVAMHHEDDCEVNVNGMVFGEIPVAEERPNPFAVLENLKNIK